MRSPLITGLMMLTSSLALAATLGTSHPALVAEIDARHAALPTAGLSKAETKQKKALERSAAALAHDGTDARAAVADARKVVGALDKAYPDDAVLGGLLDALVSGVTADVQSSLADLTAGRDALPDGKTRTKVTKNVDKAGVALGAAAAATTRVAALAQVAKAAKQVAAGTKKLSGGTGGGPTTTEFDMDVGDPPTDSVHYPVTPAGPLDHYTTVATSGAPAIFTLSAAADGAAATYAIMFSVVGAGTGTHPMTSIGGGLSVIPGDTYPLTSGSVTFTTWDPAHQKCAGTFTATFGSVPVSGSFSSTMLVVTS